MQKKKILKVSSCFYTASKSSYPKLNLQGKWLQELGFHKSDYVEVIMDNDMLLIKKIKEVEKLPDITLKATIHHQLHQQIQEEASTYQLQESEVITKIVKRYFDKK